MLPRGAPPLTNHPNPQLPIPNPRQLYSRATMWQHNYHPVGGSLGASSIAAAVPIVVLFLMLGVLRKPAWMSALAALGSAFVIALAAYGMPLQLTVMSTLFG